MYFIEFLSGLLRVIEYFPDHGAGLSGVLFPPPCHAFDGVATLERYGQSPGRTAFFLWLRVFYLVQVLDLTGKFGQRPVMVEPVSLSTARDDTLWAVVASMGRTTRVAEIFSNRLAALADKAWREQQVDAYATFLRTSRQPAPSYHIRPINRAELPRAWRPLPALGFLQGKIV